MIAPQTEALHDQAEGLDARPLPEIARLLVDGQIAAAVAVQNAIPEIAEAARLMAQSLRQGGTLHYIAAGSSGLMAAADAQELGGTYSIPPEQLRIHMAGGLPQGVEMPGDTEDDEKGLEQALATLSARDCVIALSASGTTPYTLAAAKIACAVGTPLISMANNAETPLLVLGDVAICLATPPEVISGSTRMGAGTAQKITLNMMSTLMAIELGHVHDGMMVNLHADNAKLRARATTMVARIAAVGEGEAAKALQAADGAVKPAILIACGKTKSEAKTLLKNNNDNLRAALSRLNSSTRENQYE